MACKDKTVHTGCLLKKDRGLARLDKWSSYSLFLGSYRGRNDWLSTVYTSGSFLDNCSESFGKEQLAYVTSRSFLKLSEHTTDFLDMSACNGLNLLFPISHV